MKIKKATLGFQDIELNHSQTYKLRGYISNVFKEYDLIHNHDLETGKNIYRYPLIQFKIINKTPSIIALTEEAIQIFIKIFMSLNEMDIAGIKIPIFEKDLKIEDVEFGYSQKTYTYEFISPWIGLNQKNYQNYSEEKNREGKNNILKRSLTGNILSMSKGINYWLDSEQHIDLGLKVKERAVNLKGKSMIGFFGKFKVNFLIPDYVGIGKSVSRGFGVVRRVI